MNPFATFRRLREVGRRRPILVGLVGAALLAEAARAAWGWADEHAVTVLGHGGFDELTPEEGVLPLAYVGWVGLCGLIILWGVAAEAWSRRRGMRAEAGAVLRRRERPPVVVRRR